MLASELCYFDDVLVSVFSMYGCTMNRGELLRARETGKKKSDLLTLRTNAFRDVFSLSLYKDIGPEAFKHKQSQM